MTMDRNLSADPHLLDEEKASPPLVPAQAGTQLFHTSGGAIVALNSDPRRSSRAFEDGDLHDLGPRLRGDERLGIEPFTMPPPSDRPGFDLPLPSARWRWRGA